MNMKEEAARLIYNSEAIHPDDREGILRQIVAVLRASGAITKKEERDYWLKYRKKKRDDTRASFREVRHPNGTIVSVTAYKNLDNVRFMHPVGSISVNTEAGRYDAAYPVLAYTKSWKNAKYKHIEDLPFLSTKEKEFLNADIKQYFPQ